MIIGKEGRKEGSLQRRTRLDVLIQNPLKLVDHINTSLSAGSFKYKVSVARFYFALVAYLTCSVYSLEKEIFIKNLKVLSESKNLF